MNFLFQKLLSLTVVTRNKKIISLEGYLSVTLKFTEWPQTLSITLKNKRPTVQGASSLKVIFMLYWIKCGLLFFKLHKD